MLVSYPSSSHIFQSHSKTRLSGRWCRSKLLLFNLSFFPGIHPLINDHTQNPPPGLQSRKEEHSKWQPLQDNIQFFKSPFLTRKTHDMHPQKSNSCWKCHDLRVLFLPFNDFCKKWCRAECEQNLKWFLLDCLLPSLKSCIFQEKEKKIFFCINS